MASIDIWQRLFDTLVLPGGDYGCLAWSLPLLPPVYDDTTGLPGAKLNVPEVEHTETTCRNHFRRRRPVGRGASKGGAWWAAFKTSVTSMAITA